MPRGNGLLPYYENPVLFFTATILNWKTLLKPDKYKDILISSLQFMSDNERMHIGGFVIMPNHIHLLFRPAGTHQLKDIQRDFLKYTAQRIKLDLQQSHPQQLEQFQSTQNDRQYQIWERRPLSVPLYTREAMVQKLNYIHNNPCQNKWNLADDILSYPYSSAGFYETGSSSFPFLKHYMDI